MKIKFVHLSEVTEEMAAASQAETSELNNQIKRLQAQLKILKSHEQQSFTRLESEMEKKEKEVEIWKAMAEKLQVKGNNQLKEIQKLRASKEKVEAKAELDKARVAELEAKFAQLGLQVKVNSVGKMHFRRLWRDSKSAKVSIT